MFYFSLILISLQFLSFNGDVNRGIKNYDLCPKTLANYAIEAYKTKLKCQSQSYCLSSRDCLNGNFACCHQNDGCFKCVGNLRASCVV